MRVNGETLRNWRGALNPIFIFQDNFDEGKLWVKLFPQLNGFRDMGPQGF